MIREGKYQQLLETDQLIQVGQGSGLTGQGSGSRAQGSGLTIWKHGSWQAQVLGLEG